MTRSIKINGDDSSILSVSLTDILNCLEDGEKIEWGMLWLEAVGELDGERSIVDLEQEINKSEKATMMTWKELIELSSQIIQGINLLIIGDRLRVKIKKYLTDKEMYSGCDYTIELIDSSYWIIHSKNETFLENVFKELKGVEYINPL
ncbi:hypothetical protein [Pedobacter sp. FW305-3-2-15-E-R2A2]|uniref:hypothetical protein n=1 Tax=Pedobacter sp. FW305-3-2-15-E-R2A2 TaxID=3140251 RepID=UPI0031402BBF